MLVSLKVEVFFWCAPRYLISTLKSFADSEFNRGSLYSVLFVFIFSISPETSIARHFGVFGNSKGFFSCYIERKFAKSRYRNIVVVRAGCNGLYSTLPASKTGIEVSNNFEAIVTRIYILIWLEGNPFMLMFDMMCMYKRNCVVCIFELDLTSSSLI